MQFPPPECKVYTPSQLADAMVRAIEPKPHDHWLDPCVGLGAFIVPLRKNGIPREQIVGIDIDPLAGAEDLAATTLRGVDFFEWCVSTKHKFTKIIANPPYVAIRKLNPRLQRSLLALSGEGDTSFALRSNYWCAFLSACLRMLADHENLAFVLPAAWDYALYANDVRQTVLRNFRSVEVHRCFEPLFPQVREGCVVLVAKDYLNSPAKAVRIHHKTSQSLVTALTKGISRPTKIYRQLPQTRDNSFISLSELYDINIGCVTGDARYFLLTEADRIAHGLPIETVRPVLSKARHLVSAYMSKAEWKRLLSTNERVWLFKPDAKSLRLKSVRTYLQHGERMCNLEAYKLKHRDPWYSIQGIKEGTGFLSGMTKLGPWICFRSMRNLAATNTLYVLRAKAKMGSEERAAWALSLLSTSSRRQIQDLVRRYPDGLTKLEPHELSSLRLTPPLRLTRAEEGYRRAVGLLVSGNVSAAVAIADWYTGV